jgi:hypothetical protein
VAAERRRWRVWQRYMDPVRFVFLDETGATTNMVRRYGWSPRGERLVNAAPHGHWRTTTFVAGLRSTGFVAPLVLDGPMTGEIFRAYVQQFHGGSRSGADYGWRTARACGCGRAGRDMYGPMTSCRTAPRTGGPFVC